MQMPKQWARRVSWLLLAAWALAACDDSGDIPRATRRGGAGAADKAEGEAAGGDSEKAGDPYASVLKDSDFVESEGNRDPFRSYEDNFVAAAPPKAQRPVLLPDTEVADLRLIAIITGIEQPRAMLVDDKGVGYVTTRGDYVGRPDVVRTGGAENLAVTVNWRIDRIRENEVVLARDDPTGPNRPPLTRVIPLRTEDET